MARKIVILPESADDWLARTDDQLLACRATGHAWPKIRPGRLGNKYLQATRQRDGAYQLIQICRDCGMERTLTTLPTGDIDFPARYQYRQPDGYKAPKGSGIKPRECLAEVWRRTRETMGR